MRGQLTEASAVVQYITAGHGEFTLVSQKTGTRFTFKLGTPKEMHSDRRPIFFKLLCGPENTTDYQFVGTWWCSGDFKHSPKSRISPDAPSARAIRWFLRDISKALSQCSFWHNGKCGCCGRKLTVPESIATGFGPICAARKGICLL